MIIFIREIDQECENNRFHRTNINKDGDDSLHECEALENGNYCTLFSVLTHTNVNLENLFQCKLEN